MLINFGEAFSGTSVAYYGVHYRFAEFNPLAAFRHVGGDPNHELHVSTTS
jgi:hypothetical protein